MITDWFMANAAPPAPWYDRVVDGLPEVATIVGGVVAAIALLGFARNVWRRTFGRRRDGYERLARLGTGAQLSFFVAVLGEPPAMKRKLTGQTTEIEEGSEELVKIPKDYWESFFIEQRREGVKRRRRCARGSSSAHAPSRRLQRSRDSAVCAEADGGARGTLILVLAAALVTSLFLAFTRG